MDTSLKMETPVGEPMRLKKTLRSGVNNVAEVASVNATPQFQVFGGKKSELGKVSLHSPTTFEAFVKWLPIQQIPVSRPFFPKLPEKQQKKEKRVDYICASVFSQNPSPRQNEHATRFFLVALDIDDSNDAQHFVGSPKLLMQKLGDWNFVCYLTASSTTDRPRIRIFVHAAGLDACHYHAAVEAVATRLGLRVVTSESKVLVQPMYLPSIFQGEDPVANTPVIASNVDGVPLKLADLPKTEPCAAGSGSQGPVHALAKSDQTIDLENLPDDNFSLEQGEEVLAQINPDCRRKEWIKVGAGLKNQFGEAGFDLWNSWSSRGTKYDCDVETRKQWASIRRAPVGRRASKIGTVIDMAKDAGWKPRSLIWPQFRKFVETCVREDQRGDARVLYHLAHTQFLYDHTAKMWMRYEDGIWMPDEVRRVRAESKPIISQPYFDLARTLSEEIDRDVAAGKVEGPAIKNDPRDKLRILSLRKAAQLNRRKQIDDVLNLAGDFLAARTLEFDRDPMVLNLLNGTLDLQTTHFRKHNPLDKLRKRMQVEYLPNADCPLWKTFLSTLFVQDVQTVEFVRRALGYSLTGRVDHDFIIFCYGGGSNGKSTMFEVLRMLFGDYFVHLPIEALLSQRRGQRDSHASAELVRLAAARLALASEIPAGRKLNESLIKDLSGGGVLTARSLYQDPITFEITHKLWLMGNHKPEIQGQDNGIWRRIHLVPFQHQFPKSGQVGYRKRSDVITELFKESSGILNWLLKGLRDLEANGLNPPPAVQSATDEYRSESDLLEEFINACCTLGANLSISTRDLWDAYSKHFTGETQAYTSQRKLTTAMEERGFRQKRTNSSRQLEGITVYDVI